MSNDVKLGERVIGHKVHTDRGVVFVCHRTPEHYFKIHQGFGMSMDILRTLDLHGVIEIRIVYHGKTGNRVYKTTPQNWIKKGKFYKAVEYEQQIVLKEDEFDEVVQ